MQGTPGPDGEVALDIFGYLPWETVSGKASFKLKGDTITGYHITGTVVSTSSTIQIKWGNGKSRGSRHTLKLSTCERCVVFVSWPAFS